ncbi:PPE family protein PPE34 [Mycobacterium simulans]|nr:PPE family protein PPE34 [Mycobacterium simulans]
MNFLVMPPELNSLSMYTGAGSTPMLQAAWAWDGLAAELGSAATSFTSLTSGLTDQAWQGPTSQAMAAAAAPYAGWLSAAAAHADNAAQQARTVVGVFEAAQASVVHPLAVAANRNGLVGLVMSNFFGQNAPAIAAAESVYEEMWAQDVSAMLGYHAGASQAAAALTPLGVIAGKRDPFAVLAKIIKDAAKQADNFRLGNRVKSNLTPDRDIFASIKRVEQRGQNLAKKAENLASQLEHAVRNGRTIVRNGRTFILHGEDVLVKNATGGFDRYVRASERLRRALGL